MTFAIVSSEFFLLFLSDPDAANSDAATAAEEEEEEEEDRSVAGLLTLEEGGLQPGLNGGPRGFGRADCWRINFDVSNVLG